jgi:hypothetical protein
VTWKLMGALGGNDTHRSVDSAARASDLGTWRLACQDGSHWLASSIPIVQRCTAKIRPVRLVAHERAVSSFAGSARRGHAPGAALPWKPRAAPVGAGCQHGPGPTCDHFGHRLDGSRTPRPTRNHRALVPLPRQQMPDHAARQLDERRHPRRLVPCHDPSMRNCVRYDWFSSAVSRPSAPAQP